MIDAKKAGYVLFHFKMIFGIEDLSFVSYGSAPLTANGFDENSSVNIFKSTDPFFENENPFPEKVIWKSWNGMDIPFLFSESDKPVIEYREGKAFIHYDILASAFYFLSGWQEYFVSQKDSHGRFPFSDSIQKKLNIAALPVVNYYFDILKTAIEETQRKKLNVTLWKNNSSFVTFVSHDIDKCESAWKEGGMSELKKGNIFSPFFLLAKKLLGQDAWFNFDELAALDKQFGAKATYFFIAEYGKLNGLWNADYHLTGKKMREIIRFLEEKGEETGIHASFGTHLNGEKLEKELTKFPGPVPGNRFHFLKFDMRISPQILEEAGIKYDSSMGFAEQIGFRNGYCFPYYLYDLKNNRMRKVLEIPLMVMDATLLEKRYMNCTPETAFIAVKELIDEIKKFSGCLGLLWHNNTISEYKYTGWKNVYENILGYLQQSNSSFLCGKEILLHCDGLSARYIISQRGQVTTKQEIRIPNTEIRSNN